MSNPRDARSVATRILAASARKRPRELRRSCCGSWEWREVTLWERRRRVRRRSSAVLVLLTKMSVGRSLYEGCWRSKCNVGSLITCGRRWYRCFNEEGTARLQLEGIHGG
jgi:hypothetical protein